MAESFQNVIRHSSIAKGDIEAGVKKEQEKAEDVYLLIDIKEKAEDERPLREVSECLANQPVFLGIKELLSKDKYSEIVITDEDISFGKLELQFVFEELMGKNIQIHLRVNRDQVYVFENYLQEILAEEIRVERAFSRWQNTNCWAAN